MEGHEIKTHTPFYKDSPNRVASWRPHMGWADLIIFTDSDHRYPIKLVKGLAKAPIIGADSLTDQASNSHLKMEELFHALSFDMPTYHIFDSPSDAMFLSRDWSIPCMLLPNYISNNCYLCTNEDSFQWTLLNQMSEQPIIVQDIPPGIGVTIEGWWNGVEYLEPFNCSFPSKEGSALKLCSGDTDLVKNTVSKLVGFLKKTSYCGPVHIHAIVTEENLYVTGVHFGFLPNTTEAFIEGLSSSFADFLHKVATGYPVEIPLGKDYSLAVKASIRESNYVGIPIQGINESNLPHLFLQNVELGEDGIYRQQQINSHLLVATAHGRNVAEASGRVLRTLGNLNAFSLEYVRSVGSGVPRSLQSLEDWGYLRSLEHA